MKIIDGNLKGSVLRTKNFGATQLTANKLKLSPQTEKNCLRSDKQDVNQSLNTLRLW